MVNYQSNMIINHLFLPSHNFINNLLLFSSSSAKINSRSFYAFVSHKVSKKGNIIELF